MLGFPRPKKTLRGYLEQYASEHQTSGNKVTHLIGIPMIVASLPTMLVSPPVGGAMFVAGWGLQLVGHYVFEKNEPAFFDDPYYLLVGPVWVGLELAELAGIPLPDDLAPSRASKREAEAPAAVAVPVTAVVSPLN